MWMHPYFKLTVPLQAIPYCCPTAIPRCILLHTCTSLSIYLCTLTAPKAPWSDVTSLFKCWHTARCAPLLFQFGKFIYLQSITVTMPQVSMLSLLEVLDLLAHWGEEQMQTHLNTSHQNAKIYQQLSEQMQGDTIKTQPRHAPKSRSSGRIIKALGTTIKPLIIFLGHVHTLRSWNRYLLRRPSWNSVMLWTGWKTYSWP